MQDKHQTYRTSAFEAPDEKGGWRYWIYMPAGHGHISEYTHMRSNFLHSSHYKVGVSPEQAVEMLAAIEKANGSNRKWDDQGVSPWQENSDKISWPDYDKAQHHSKHPINVKRGIERSQSVLRDKYPQKSKFKLGPA